MKKYILLALVLCGMTASSIGLCCNAVGVFYTPVSEDLGVLRGTFALHNTVGVMATAFTALFMGKILTKFNLKAIITLGVLMAAAATVLMGFSRSMALFHILAIIRGIGCCFYANLPITMIIINWFHKKHGLITSLVLGCSGIAGAVFSPMLTSCIEKFGWQTSYIIMGVLIFLLGLPGILFRFSLRPENCGCLPYGYEEKEEQAVQRDIHISGKKIAAGLFAAMCIFATIQPLLTGIPQHFTGYSVAVGLSAASGAAMVSAAMIGNIGTKLLVGMISDKLGAVKACVLMTLMNILALAVIFVGGETGSMFMLLAGSVAFGSVYSVAAVGLSLLTRHFFGAENYASVFPFVTFVSNAGSAFSLAIIGYVYDFTGAYDYVFAGAMVIHIICLALIFFMSAGSRKDRKKI